MRLNRPLSSYYPCALIATALALVMSSARPARADSTVAVITYPSNHATNADVTLPIQWTSVANAQGYYLYVGSTPGAKDLVNTGTMQQMSYFAPALPSGVTLYARLWTMVAGHWQYVDSSFTAAALVRTRITFPANGATGADLTKPIQWIAVPNGQSYYLYVGSTPGAKDLVNTGEIVATSYLPLNLPHSQTLYARMWTKTAGVWRYVDSTFSVAPRARITYPANGAVNADVSKPIQWTSIANVQAYYLYIGSTIGAKDLVNSGEILQSSFLAVNLPAGQTLYARIWAMAGGVWRYADSTFTAAPSAPAIATLTYPADDAVDVDQTQLFRWTAIDNAQAYYLYIGSTPGAKDLVNSYELTTTSFLTSRGGAPLPAGRTLYARLWTKLAGVWRYRDSTFIASPMAPQFIYPVDGAIGVDATLPFRWSPPANAFQFELRIGTQPGGTDVFRSGPLTTTSVMTTGLPAIGTLYARALAKVNTTWTFTDIAFTRAPSVLAATIVAPSNGALNVDTGQAFQWTPVSLARGYRLMIGRAPGGNDLHDSGEIQVTRRFVPNLPVGPAFGTLMTKLNGVWATTVFTFSVSANTLSTQSQIDAALWATNFVRGMAATDNRPYNWTALAKRRFFVTCADYAATLLQVWSDVNGQLPARRLDIALNPNGLDTHTLDELFLPDTQSWMLLDPTFDLSVKRVADNGWAAAEDVSAATRNLEWDAMSYVFLGSLGDYYARGYPIDYPLLYLDVYHQGQTATKGQGATVLPYMLETAMPVSAPRQLYAIGCSDMETTPVAIDGVEQAVDCSGVDGMSSVFGASTIGTTTETPSTVKAYRLRRFVF